MLDKIMRAAKSNNKKRGRNVTIGAVVGMLLSCTAVIKADDYLWIKNDGGKIKFSTIAYDFDDETEWEDGNPYSANKWDGNTYINNIILSETNNGNDEDGNTIGYGLRLSGDFGKNFNFENNGEIAGIGQWSDSDSVGSGIYIDSSLTGNLTNNGEITGSVTVDIMNSSETISVIGSGMYIDSSLTGNLTNNGEIAGSVTVDIMNSSETISVIGSGMYIGSSLEGNLTNNGEITASAIVKVIPGGGISEKIVNIGSGMYIGSSLTGNLTNNGEIAGFIPNYDPGSSRGIIITFSTYGMYIDSSLTGSLTNNGVIIGEGITSTAGFRIEAFFNFGINIGSSLTGNLLNTGSITTTGTNSGTGINIGSSLTGNLTNAGLITGIGIGIGTGSSTGIKILNLEGNLTNTGLITGIKAGSDEGTGIFIDSSAIGKLTNTGAIYGKTNAIKNANGPTSDNVYNYGILVSSENNVIAQTGLVDKYGLVFRVESDDSYTLNSIYSGGFGKIYSGTDVVIGYKRKADGELDFNAPIFDKYTIVNAKSKESSSNVIGTESLVLRNGTLFYDDSKTSEIKDYSSTNKYILNGITDTLKVAGKHNKLNNSVINAYKTAVVMDESKSMLTLNNTVVNGNVSGLSDISTINITGEGNNFTIKGNSVINTGYEKDGNKGVAITVGGKCNAVVLDGNTIVNGEIKSTGSNNILALNGTGKDGMNMLHNISGFTNMNIDSNVTFSEDIKVTGTDTVTVEGTGILNLRLKKEEASSGTKVIHAFSENGKMSIEGNSPDEAGTLNFITNGIGRVIDIDMTNITLENMKIKTSSIIDKAEIKEDFIRLGAGSALGEIVNPKEVKKYDQLDKIYKSIYNSREENIDGLREALNITYFGKNYTYNNRTAEEQLASLLGYLNDTYVGTPYSFSSELSRRSVGMFRDIITENEFRPNLDNWVIMGGLTHADGGTKDIYYGKNYYKIDGGSSDTNADMKLTGAYMLAKYGYSENTSLGLTVGGNKSESEMSMSKVKGNSGYLGAFAENYRGNLVLKAGAGVQYSEYDADRSILGGYNYSDKYSDMTYDIYLNGRYSHQVGDNLYFEPYATLSYTYIDQDGADEGNKTLAIETNSKSFDYTVGKVGVDLKKVIPHEKGKSSLTAGVSYTKILDGAEEEYITGRFKGSTTDFDILVAHKNEHSIGLNAKYTLELKNGIIFDAKGTYSAENSSGKNKTKGEWIVGAGIGYKF